MLLVARIRSQRQNHLASVGLRETNFIELQDPTNIYSLSTILHQGTRKALVATQKEVLCAEAKELPNGALEWKSRPLPFVPEGAEVIALDAFNQIPNHSPVIGVTLVTTKEVQPGGQAPSSRPGGTGGGMVSSGSSGSLNVGSSAANSSSTPSSGDTKLFYLYIYGPNCSQDDTWERIGEDCYVLKLEFTPFSLMHETFDFAGGSQTAFLLAGNDYRVHLYKQSVGTASASFHELLGSKFLPSLSTIYTESVLSIDTEVFGTMGLLAVGCQDGSVQVNMKQEGYLRAWSIILDGPISSVKLYKTDKVGGGKNSKKAPKPDQHSHPLIRKVMEQVNKLHGQSQEVIEEPAKPEEAQPLHPADKGDGTAHIGVSTEFEAHLICGGAIGYAVVFKNVLERGLEEPYFLPDSDKYDSVLAVALSESELGGQPTILVGTYGRKLLAYQEKVETNWDRNSSRRSRRGSVDLDSQLRDAPLDGTVEAFGEVPDLGSHSSAPRPLSHSADPKISVLDDLPLSANVSPVRIRPPSAQGLEEPREADLSASPRFKLVWDQNFNFPIHDVASGDFTNDGLKDIVVCSMFGLHLLQTNIQALKEKVSRRLKLISQAVQAQQQLEEIQLMVQGNLNAPH